jgi:serine/threonine protein kinase
MFLDEARIAARLNHPNITQIYNLGAQGGTYFIAMEYVDGMDVREIWRMCEARGAPMPPQHACRIIAESAAALQHAHKKTNKQGKPLGIVHRDVSPQNILVTTAGGVKVVDFGIAKAADSSTHTRAGVLKGKFAYMSPEQAIGGRIDRRTDIFALGVVLHELLVGRRLFKRDTDVATLNAVGQCAVDPPSDYADEADDELDDIVLKALAKNPKDRYQESEELQKALDSWLLNRSLRSGAAALAEFVAGLAAEIDKKAAERQRKSGPSKSKKKPVADLPAPPVPSAEEEEEEEEAGTKKERGAREREPTQDLPAPPKSRRTGTLAAPPPSDAQKSSKGAIGILAFLLGVALVAIVALVGMQLKPQVAVLKINSQPPGASVFWNGEQLKEKTPCALPPAGAGSYWLEVSLDGYEAYRAKIDVPEKGEREIAVVLKPLK